MQIKAVVSKILIVCFCLSLITCSSGKKAFRQGDYFRACEEAVNRLRSKPDHKDAADVLRNAYPLALKVLQKDIEEVVINKYISSYEQIVYDCDRMSQLADEINHCPAALAIIPNPKKYTNARNRVIQVATAILYDKGIKALESGSMDQARQALNYFRQVNKYNPEYKDVRDKLEQSYYEATLRVIVAQPLLPPKYQLSATFFYDKLMNEISRTTYNHLVRFYTPEEAQGSGMDDPHHILELHFEDFTVGNSRQTSNTMELSRDSVLIGTTTGTTGVKQNVYGTVKAKYTVHHLELISGGVLGLRIIDALNGRVFNHKDFQGTYVWTSEWATYNGDERALTNSQKALAQKRQLPLPSPQVLFAGFADPLYAQVTRYISSIY